MCVPNYLSHSQTLSQTLSQTQTFLSPLSPQTRTVPKYLAKDSPQTQDHFYLHGILRKSGQYKHDFTPPLLRLFAFPPKKRGFKDVYLLDIIG